MILFGRDLSPFTRRVAIWCMLQGREVERRQLMVTGADFETLKSHNPLGRVPILVLDDGTELIESVAIIDWLEDSAPAQKRLLPETGLARRESLQRWAIANSCAEKAVSLVYDKNRRPEEFHYPDWIARLEAQIRDGLGAMEGMVPDHWFGGDSPDGADVAFVCTVDFVATTNPYLLDGRDALSEFAERANAHPAISASRPVAV